MLFFASLLRTLKNYFISRFFLRKSQLCWQFFSSTLWAVVILKVLLFSLFPGLKANLTKLTIFALSTSVRNMSKLLANNTNIVCIFLTVYNILIEFLLWDIIFKVYYALYLLFVKHCLSLYLVDFLLKLHVHIFINYIQIIRLINIKMNIF